MVGYCWRMCVRGVGGVVDGVDDGDGGVLVFVLMVMEMVLLVLALWWCW